MAGVTFCSLSWRVTRNEPVVLNCGSLRSSCDASNGERLAIGADTAALGSCTCAARNAITEAHATPQGIRKPPVPRSRQDIQSCVLAGVTKHVCGCTLLPRISGAVRAARPQQAKNAPLWPLHITCVPRNGACSSQPLLLWQLPSLSASARSSLTGEPTRLHLRDVLQYFMWRAGRCGEAAISFFLPT